MLSNVDQKIGRILEAAKCDGLITVLSGPDNFRYHIAKTQPYKGNRKSEKPYYHSDIRHHIEEHYDPIISDGIEADDEVRILSLGFEDNSEFVIASIDKDLLQCVGTHYNWRRNEFTEVDDDYSNYWFWAQCLIGDTADNIPGIKGYGPKKSEKLLRDAEPDERKRIVREIYGDDERLTEVGNLLHILRSYDDCFDPETY